MKKRILAALLAGAMVLSIAGCQQSQGGNTTTTPAGGDTTTPAGGDTTTPAASNSEEVTTPAAETPAKEQGKVFNIWVWNDEFKNFFLQYYAGTMALNQTDVDEKDAEPIYYDKAPGIPEGITVEFTKNPSDGGVYQQKLDEALLAQDSAAADKKIDMFLAEADYIKKYVNTPLTLDVAELGYKPADTIYPYTISAASDANGVLKGVSFQCCPAALIYRRSIAKDVLGTDDPAEVQKALDSWEKFEAVAADAKAKGYYMTASFAETYRTYSNNATSAWVDSNNNLVIPEEIKAWVAQTKKFADNEYTLMEGIWDPGKNAQMYADGKTMCFFGPAWYYNFCMSNAQDAEKGCFGDWAITTGPQEYFWGGTWLLAATGTDNDALLKDIFEFFTANEDACTALVKDQMQFVNNTAVNEKCAAEGGNDFLGGQNDTALFLDLAKNIKFEYKTGYDQLLNEEFQTKMKDYFNGTVDEATAYANFYAYVKSTYPDINVPA